MDEIPEYLLEPELHLELRGFEAGTSKDVYGLACKVNASLLLKLESFGYEQKSGIKLSNGLIIDGWMKI